MYGKCISVEIAAIEDIAYTSLCTLAIPWSFEYLGNSSDTYNLQHLFEGRIHDCTVKPVNQDT